tara:strand:- start:857 stop:1222 length:366 start_codon:yes stop_codon:yes gene_type:complete
MNTLNNSELILDGLPASFVADVKRTLGAWSETNIKYNTETGEYDHWCHIGISGNPNNNIIHLGTVYANEVLTLDEQIVAYVKNFKDFPFGKIKYDGERDYLALRGEWSDVVMNDGNLEFIK